MVVDTSNPAAPSVLETLTIPGMAVVTGIAVQGNQAFVIGSSLDWLDGVSGLAGNVVVAALDLTNNPANPTVLPSQILNIPSIGMGFVYSVGNNQYVTSSLAGPSKHPEILVFDASNPSNVTVTPVSVPNGIEAAGFTVAGNNLFAVDGASLSIYNIGAAAGVPVTAQVTIPAGVAASSFSLAPTSNHHESRRLADARMGLRARRRPAARRSPGNRTSPACSLASL